MPQIDVPGREHPVDIPDEEYTKGPPEIVVEGEHWTRFTDRSPAQQVEAWRQWLKGGRDLVALKAARRAAERATTMARDPVRAAVAFELPVEMEVISVPEINYGNLNDVGPLPADAPMEHPLSDRELNEIGPPDRAGAFDPAFRDLDPAERTRRWRDYLRFNPPPTPAYVDAQVWFLHLMDRRVNDPIRFRALDMLGLDFQTDPKKSWTTVLLGLLVTIGGVTGGVLSRVLRDDGEADGEPVAAPTGLTVASTPTPSGAASGHDVTVTWVLPTAGPAAERWDVTCTPTASGQGTTTRVDGTMTSAVVPGVAAGTYTVTVVGSHRSVSGQAATTTATVPTASAPPRTAGPPDEPAAVTVTGGLSSTTNLRGLTVAWTPATTGPSPTGYSLLVRDTTRPAPVEFGPVATGPVTSYRFEPLPPGTYQAIVVALNGDESSQALTSASTTFAGLPDAVPDPPRNLVTHVYASDTPGRAALTVMWDPPIGGTEVAGYDVGLAGTKAVRRVGRARSATYDPVADGAWAIGVVSYNQAGRSRPLNGTVAVDHTMIDADGVSWAPVLARSEIDAVEKFTEPFSAVDEKTFWDNVMRAVEDTAGVHGGLATYPTMLFLARLLTLWIEVPATPPTEDQISAMADRIATDATFPTSPPVSEHADRMGPWRAAFALVSPVTKKSLPVRYKMFGLVRALERYLGEHK